MLKKTILVVAALGAVFFASGESADASVRARHVAHAGWTRHTSSRSGFAHRSALRGRHRYGRVAAERRRFGREAYAHGRGRLRLARSWSRRGAGRGIARQDAMIRRYVGPRSAYAPATTRAGYGVQTGGASYYSGGRTANGGLVGAATCAHRSLPFGTRVLVTNLANAHQMVLTVNDRGPFVRGRILDVSRIAAASLGMLASGTAPVRIQVVGGPG